MGNPNEFRFLHVDAALKFAAEVGAVLVERDRAAVLGEPGLNSVRPWVVYLPTDAFKPGVTRRELAVMAEAAARVWIYGEGAVSIAWAEDMRDAGPGQGL